MNTHNSEYINDQMTSSGSADLITLLSLYVTLLLVFLLPFADGFYDGIPRITATIAISLAAISFFIRGTHKDYTFFHFFIILYVGWLVISLIWTLDLEWGIFFAKTTVQLILLCFLFTLVFDSLKKMMWAYQAYVFGNIVGSGIIIYNYFNGIMSFYYGRYGIANIETDTLSVYLALSIPIAAYLTTIYKNRKILKFINLISIPLVFYAIFLTGTRTGSIVGMVGIAYWLFTHRKASFAIKASIIIVIIASIIAIFSFAPKASVDRIFSSGKSISSGTLNSRTTIWRGSLNQWEKNPIKGTGLGGLGYALSHEHVEYRSAHNAFIHLLAENGIIGLLLYLAIIFSVLYYILLLPTNEKAFLLSLLMVLVISQLTIHSQNEKIMWFILTILAIHSNKLLTTIKDSS